MRIEQGLLAGLAQFRLGDAELLPEPIWAPEVPSSEPSSETSRSPGTDGLSWARTMHGLRSRGSGGAHEVRLLRNDLGRGEGRIGARAAPSSAASMKKAGEHRSLGCAPSGRCGGAGPVNAASAWA